MMAALSSLVRRALVVATRTAALAVVLVGIWTAPAYAGVQLSINGGAGPSFSAAVMNENADQYGVTVRGSGPKSYVSVKALVELAGIDPDSLGSSNAMTITIQNVTSYGSAPAPPSYQTFSRS
jgi:hypothetical protein